MSILRLLVSECGDLLLQFVLLSYDLDLLSLLVFELQLVLGLRLR